MSCKRCNSDDDLGPRGWCRDCEREYDTWVRRHASDIIWPVLAGMVIISAVALGLPLLGAGYVVATTGVFAGFGTLVGLQRLNARRRRKQFQLASLPRAYLPSKT
jgi:hypothetical protein